MATMVKETNAILSNRMHAFKKQYYRLDIIVGKVFLWNYKKCFSQEDRLALQLREQFKDWETRVSLAMIPFYKERLTYITAELQQKEPDQSVPREDIEFLKNTRTEVQRKYDNEKREVQELSFNLEKSRIDIEALRNQQGYTSSNVRLVSHQKTMPDGSSEFSFNLLSQNISLKKADGSSLKNEEASRRSHI